jgi:hypothetical protein
MQLQRAIDVDPSNFAPSCTNERMQIDESEEEEEPTDAK